MLLLLNKDFKRDFQLSQRIRDNKIMMELEILMEKVLVPNLHPQNTQVAWIEEHKEIVL